MIENFINSISSGDSEKTDVSFNKLIMSKINTVLDIKRIELTSDIFNKQQTKISESLSESVDCAYKSALEQEQSNPRFVQAQATIACGLTPNQTEIFNGLINQWSITGGNLQQILRGFYQKVYVSGNNPANPVMQKALAYVLDKL